MKGLGFGQWDHIVDHLATVNMLLKKTFFLLNIKFFLGYVISYKQFFLF